ncbi:MAG: DUF1571 domain-containing protein [Gemmataceae bacterium]
MTACRVTNLIIVSAIAISASPRGPGFSSSDRDSFAALKPAANSQPFTAARFEELVPRDPVAAMGEALTHYRSTVRGFTATMHKQERIGKTLFPPEVIRMAVREEPFAVSMTWEKGIRNQAAGTLYVAGENGGNMIVWRPDALLAKTLKMSPNETLARSASRYCLAESSLSHGHLRTYLRWKQVQESGKLAVEYRGKHAVAELGGIVCHELVRTCSPEESDSFSIGEPARTTPAEQFTKVTIYLDAETGMQVGAVLNRADGELVGSYLFRGVVLNPSFPEGQFTERGFRK